MILMIIIIYDIYNVEVSLFKYPIHSEFLYSPKARKSVLERLFAQFVSLQLQHPYQFAGKCEVVFTAVKYFASAS